MTSNSSLSSFNFLSKKRLTSSLEKFMKYETFLSKLYDILNSENSAYSKIIRWNKEGDGIIISDANKLSKIILPKYYKHQNYSSFVRQLNMYGFHKTKDFSEDNIKEEEYKSQKFNKKCTKDEIKRISRKKIGRKEVNEDLINSKNFNYDMINSSNDLNYLLMLIERNYQKELKLQEEVLELKEENNELNKKLEMYRNSLVEKNEKEKKMRNFFRIIKQIMNRFKNESEIRNKNKFVEIISMDNGNNNDSKTKDGLYSNTLNSLSTFNFSNSNNKKKCSFLDLAYKYLNHLGKKKSNKNSVDSNNFVDSNNIVFTNNNSNVINQADSFSINNENNNVKEKNIFGNIENDLILLSNKNELSLLDNFPFERGANMGGFLENDSSDSLSCNLFNCNNH